MNFPNGGILLFLLKLLPLSDTLNTPFVFCFPLLVKKQTFSLFLPDVGHSTHHPPIPSEREGGSAALPVRAPQAGGAVDESRVGPAALRVAQIRPAGGREGPGFANGPDRAWIRTEGHETWSGESRTKVSSIKISF